jgi:maleylpyruvate isomerase
MPSDRSAGIMSASLILHGYWRSSAAYRVRIALNLKGLAYDQVNHDLRTGAQHAADYRTIAPHGLVPALVDGGNAFIQSPAILEWLEERYPLPALLPADIEGRAIVRSMISIVACDIHPLNNLRVLDRLRGTFGAHADAITGWIAGWIAEGFSTLEELVRRHGKGYCFGAAPTLADCTLVPQLYSAERFGVDLSPYPALMMAGEAARARPAFIAAHPDRQPDADRP